MKRSTFKLRARRILDVNGGSARLTAFFVPCVKLVLLGLTAFFIYSLSYSFKLENSEFNAAVYLYRAVLILSSFICLILFIYSGFLLKRWYILNNSDMRFSDLFRFPDLKLLIKLLLLSFIKLLYGVSAFAVYEIPFAVTGFLLYRALSLGEVKLGVTVTTAVLAAVLFLGGIIFFFAEFQRFSAAEYILALHPEMKLRHVLRLSFSSVRETKFTLAFFKMSFFGWFLICIFILPLFFVLPYYLQSVAEITKPSLKASSSVLDNL